MSLTLFLIVSLYRPSLLGMGCHSLPNFAMQPKRVCAPATCHTCPTFLIYLTLPWLGWNEAPVPHRFLWILDLSRRRVRLPINIFILTGPRGEGKKDQTNKKNPKPKKKHININIGIRKSKTQPPVSTTHHHTLPRDGAPICRNPMPAWWAPASVSSKRAHLFGRIDHKQDSTYHPGSRWLTLFSLSAAALLPTYCSLPQTIPTGKHDRVQINKYPPIFPFPPPIFPFPICPLCTRTGRLHRKRRGSQASGVAAMVFHPRSPPLQYLLLNSLL